MNMLLIITCCAVLCAAACGAFAVYQLRKTRAALERLLQELDDAITGNLQSVSYDESLDAAIRERLNRVVQIAGMQRDDAQKERDAVKALISDISHQVRTPLSNILLYTELLEETLRAETEFHSSGDADAPEKRCAPTDANMAENSCSANALGVSASASNSCPAENRLQTIVESCLPMALKIRRQSEKLDFFIRELTRSSYAEQEMIAIHPKKVDANELISQACQTAEVAALKKHIRILRQEEAASRQETISRPETASRPTSDDDACLCFADPKWTVEALANILDNAIKYSPEGSDIHIDLLRYESFVCISIADSGIGIAPEEQGAIFRRFYRSPSVSDTPGFGIGLYLVREILTRQGGYVKAESRPGHGATFRVFLSKLSPLGKN